MRLLRGIRPGILLTFVVETPAVPGQGRMAEQRPAVSIVVPMHDEAATAEALVTRIRAAMERAGHTFEIILVDDGSRDDTAATIRQTAHGAAHSSACSQSFNRPVTTTC